jgi:hypothetical protein
MVKRKFTTKQIDEANDRDIIQLAKSFGLELKRKGVTYKSPGYGGLYLHPKKNCFYCFSAEEIGAGGGPIQFVMFIRQCTFVEAMYFLLGDGNKIEAIKERTVEEEKKIFALPEKSKNYSCLYAYLIKRRKIAREVIDLFVKEKLLYENTYHSCCFVGYDFSGIPRHCSIRGTVTDNAFKGETQGSEKEYAFHRCGVTKTLHVFEAPIDLMSYFTMFPRVREDHHLALCCLSDVALSTYLKHYDIQCIFLHLDNDVWGEKATKSLTQRYEEKYQVWDERPLPEYKDFNEMLKRKGCCGQDKKKISQIV